jgi:hypothetical protein
LVAGSLARLGKKAVAAERTSVWGDQSGFYLLPHTVRTWAPCGQTPILHVPLTHDHLAAISGITPAGRLFRQTQEHASRSPDVVRFLRRLVRQIQGKVLLIWDGAPIHRRSTADPPGPADQGLPAAGRREASASGAVAGLRP